MLSFPETRHSLLVRLKDPRDQAAWGTFVVAYRPVIYRMARRRGIGWPERATRRSPGRVERGAAA